MSKASKRYHVFLSYSRKDADIMRRVRDALRVEGLTVWIDEGLEPGTPSWEKDVGQAIKDAGCMVVLLSLDAAESPWVIRETAFAEEWDVRIFPVLIRGTPREAVPIRLTSHQRIDARRDLDGAIRRLSESVRKYLDVAGPPTQSESGAREEARPVSILPLPFGWCEIPAGQVEIEGQLFQVAPFYMAKYPVTYAQFQVFVDAKDGFGNPSWWEGLAAGADHKQQPGNQRFKIDNHPRENVSWYDAVAFCRWLTAKYSQGLLPFSLREKGPGDGDGGLGARDWEIRLPTEWEWQWAAQGGDGRDYPWGPNFDTARCNTEESGIKQTTPVDQYLSGGSPFGVIDMAGNVWEWCLNKADNPENTSLAGAPQRAVRGGAWILNQDFARCACRHGDLPTYQNYNLGFRVVCARPLST